MKWQLLCKKIPQDPSEIIRLLLRNRGIRSEVEMAEFLSAGPDYYRSQLQPESFFSPPQLVRAVKLVTRAIAQKRPIVIHGDYDVDGICATAILWEVIYHDLDYRDVYPFIPDRARHGYGLSRASVDALVAGLKKSGGLDAVNPRKAPLLITVDCGINSAAAAAYARRKGLQVVITDHHTRPKESRNLPKVSALLHTYRLAGAGVAWMFGEALRKHWLHERLAKDSPVPKRLDLVALATIADVQPLTGCNRWLVKEGLSQLSQTNRVGLRALKQVAQIDDRPIGPYEVGWIIAPRLNAVGRLANAMDALRLLCTRSFNRALDLARWLNQLNQQRQQMTKQALEQARAQVTNEPILFVSHPEWHEGIIGLIAGKLAEEFYRPAIVIAEGERISKASARSIPGVNIVEIIQRYQQDLVSGGGHELAAGFALKTEKIAQLRGELTRLANAEFGEILQQERLLEIDLRLDWSLVNWALYQKLESLKPHGLGNPAPLFLSSGEIKQFRPVGQGGAHLQLVLASTEDRLMRAIGFGLTQKAHELNLGVGDKIDLVYTIVRDDFRQGKELQLKITDFKKPHHP